MVGLEYLTVRFDYSKCSSVRPIEALVKVLILDCKFEVALGSLRLALIIMYDCLQSHLAVFLLD